MNGQTIRVLLIEDSPLQARLIQELLSEVRTVRIECEWVDRLSRGIECLARGGIEAVLLDLTLPDSWGVETLTTLRNRFPEVPVVVLMSGGDESLLAGAENRGAHDWVSKDAVDAVSLEDSLRRAMNRARASGG
jgi:DNA-binding NarL/FixJ family response regulator